jgi:orotidine-5'-phosphate decarboxylase
MQAYFYSLFQEINADAVVLNPYMGEDVWALLKNYPNKAGIMLVRTSNPGSAVIQQVNIASGLPLWRYILEVVISEWKKGISLIPVLASNSNDDFSDIRKIIPNEMPVFLAGIGAQEGHTECIKNLVNLQGRGVMVNSSRGILYPYQSNKHNWQMTVDNAVLEFKDRLNLYR